MFRRFHASEAPHTMTAVSIQAPPLSLDPATRSTLLQTIVDCLPVLPNASDTERAALRDAAFALVAALDPRDPVQAMFTAHLIAAHYAALNAYRCAARHDLPLALHTRYQKSAASLSRLTIARLRELKRLQGVTLLPAKVAAPVAGARAPQAQTAAAGAPARQAVPAARPEAQTAGKLPGGAAPADAVAGTGVSTGDATLDHILAEVAGRLADAGIVLAA
jgi:hypothetical protein